VVKVVLACLIGLVGWGVTRYRRGVWPSLVSTALLVAVADGVVTAKIVLGGH